MQFPTERKSGNNPLLAETASNSAAKLLSKGKARRIAVNIAKLRELVLND